MRIIGYLLLGLAGVFALAGVFLIWVPVVGLLLLASSAVCYFIAQFLKREARRIEVRRQQGGDWLG